MHTPAESENPPSPWSIAIVGLIALALAMGVGRFAFTPMLPMMQVGPGLSLQHGGWLASSNYAGYLLGALTISRITTRPAQLIRVGLVLTVATTLGMGFTTNLQAWMALRLVAGVASAWLLVSVSFWALHRLQTARRPGLGSIVFSGVGVGIKLVGLVCMLLDGWRAPPATAWLVLGAMSLILAGSIWRDFPGGRGDHAPTTVAVPVLPRGAYGQWRLVVCFGAFGLGYILPATFLPALARDLVDDPLIFGLAWPVFGLAAAFSTLLASRLSDRFTRRGIWSSCHLIMALGVALPALWHHPAAIGVAALCVGGTFMVITMAGMQEAREVGGDHARELMAGMTAAFATGQVIGPLLVGGNGGRLSLALLLAAACLVASAAALRWSGPSTRSVNSRRGI